MKTDGKIELEDRIKQKINEAKNISAAKNIAEIGERIASSPIYVSFENGTCKVEPLLGSDTSKALQICYDIHSMLFIRVEMTANGSIYILDTLKNSRKIR